MSLVVVHLAKALLKNKGKFCIVFLVCMIFGFAYAVFFSRHYHAVIRVTLPHYQSKQGDLVPLTDSKYFTIELNQVLAQNKKLLSLYQLPVIQQEGKTGLLITYNSTLAEVNDLIRVVKILFNHQLVRLSKQKPFLLGLAEKHKLDLRYSVVSEKTTPSIRGSFFFKWVLVSFVLACLLVLLSLFFKVGGKVTD